MRKEEKSWLYWLLFLSFGVASVVYLLSVFMSLLISPFKLEHLIALIFGLAYLSIPLYIYRIVGKLGTPKLSELIKAMVFFWFLTPLLVAIPFSIITKPSLDLFDSYFEMVSGLTGTGLSVIVPEKMSALVNAIRASSQWVGEVGALFLSMTIVIIYKFSPTGVAAAIGKSERVRPSMYQTLRELAIVYLILTVIGIALLLLSGLDLYSSIVFTFTALATGGFSTSSLSAAQLTFIQQATVIFICILGATNFSIYLLLLHGSLKRALMHPELKMLVLSILFYAALLVYLNPKLGFWNAFFHSASAVTTSGFSISDIARYSIEQKFVLVLAMLIGASTFSTGGGIKLFRVYILPKVIKRETFRMVMPKGYVEKITVNGKVYPEDELFRMLTFIIVYFIVFLISATLISISISLNHLSYTQIIRGKVIHKTIPEVDVLFEVASAMSGTGLSSGLLNVATPDIKLILIVDMIVGKLEILPVLYVLIELLSIKKLRRD